MARQTRSTREIEEVKNHIIEEAMALILEKGFDGMSIRGLARRVGMSPTNIYYYYSGKDEIYLNIQIRGFELLKQRLEAVASVGQDPRETLEHILRAYLAFGFENPDYYQIMLNSHSPRYLEYKDMNGVLESVAHGAKQAAVNAIAVPLKIIGRILGETGKDPGKEVFNRGYQMWITLHGIVTLNNRNILAELDEVAPTELIDYICSDLVRNL